MLSSGMMAALGQVAIPIPFVGAAVGGMIGYTLSSMFYQTTLQASRDARFAEDNLLRVREIESAARLVLDDQHTKLDAFIQKEIPQLQRETKALFAVLNAANVVDADTFCLVINTYAELLGKKLAFSTQAEFDAFMALNQPLVL
ncbi:MAG: hypothetical protein RIR18_2034 [Pseudomonadota bacterium]